jgi:hypothetical protein
MPTIVLTAKPATAEAILVAQGTEPKTEGTPEGQKGDVVPRRTFADITASPLYDHSPDYGWLQGELQLVHVRNCWRLRYASVDEEDRYGGAVTIANPNNLGQFKDRQIVRVSGHLVDPESNNSAYEVAKIQACDGN